MKRSLNKHHCNFRSEAQLVMLLLFTSGEDGEGNGKIIEVTHTDVNKTSYVKEVS